jgi:hypothetical protein
MKSFFALSDNSNFIRAGRLFKKQLLRYGRWVRPDNKAEYFQVTPELVAQMVSNFNAKIIGDKVPLYLAQQPSQPHLVHPTDSVGWIVGLLQESDGMYILADIPDEKVADKAEKKLLPGISAEYVEHYHRTEDGSDVGAVLKNAVLCNLPYIKNLSQWETVQLSDSEHPVIVLSEDSPMKLEDLLKQLLDEHKIDVKDLQSKAVMLASVQTKLSEGGYKNDGSDVVKLADVTAMRTENSTLKTENTTLKSGKDAEAVKLAENNATLTTEKATLLAENTNLKKQVAHNAAVEKVNPLVADGRILAKDKESWIKLAEDAPATFDALVPTLHKQVQLGELGTGTGDKVFSATEMKPEQVAAEVDRLAKEHGLSK